jgi:outer membrane protein assembly factor BamA
MAGNDPLLSGQSLSTVRKILVTGYKKTKLHIIEREIMIREGGAYTVAEILSHIRTSRQNLMNTALFVDVSITPCNWENDTLDITVDVKERWYYWPFLYVKPIDRNWNVWVNEYGMSFDRVNYGVKLKGDNVTGRNDKLSIWLVSGYTRQLAFKYFNPFADRSLRHGYGFEFSYNMNREVNYGTEGNRQMFFKGENAYMREQMYAGLSYSYRKGSINRHTAKLGYWIDKVHDTILQMNPGFFNERTGRVTFPELSYAFQHLEVDYIPYPSRGHTFEFNFMKRGLGGPMDLWLFNLKTSKHWTMPHGFYYSLQAEGTLKLPFDQSFVNQSFLGYGDSYLRGLEYYVVDGVAGGFLRQTIRKEIGHLNLRTGLKSRTYGSIPFRFYLKAYGDAGYVHNPNRLTGDLLTNRMIYTGGFGLDILTIYDWVIRLEYSFNQLNQSAFYFHKNLN